MLSGAYTNFTQINSSTIWSAPSYHASGVFDNQLWIMATSAGWSARVGHASAVFDYEM